MATADGLQEEVEDQVFLSQVRIAEFTRNSEGAWERRLVRYLLVRREGQWWRLALQSDSDESFVYLTVEVPANEAQEIANDGTSEREIERRVIFNRD